MIHKHGLLYKPKDESKPDITVSVRQNEDDDSNEEEWVGLNWCNCSFIPTKTESFL